MNEALVVLVRGMIAFFTLLIFARILGKQQVSQLTMFEYILGITIGSAASSLTTDLSSAAWPHWVGLLTWTGAVVALQWLTVKWRAFSIYINGEPEIIIASGKIMEETMKKMRYSIHDLLEQLRQKDVFDIEQVEFAVVETNGELSVLKKSEYQALTRKDMKVTAESEGVSIEVIFNGMILDHHLSKARLSRKWLRKELRKKGIKDISEVFLAVVNTSGDLYIDTYKDRMKGPVNQVNIKKGGTK